MTFFTLTVATSADAYIARANDDAPQNWASAEEQKLFFEDVEAADWAIMGRNTHLAADKPHRRRVIFSTQTAGWQRPTQLWIDPTQLAVAELENQTAKVHPLQNGLILGGTRVHDWFLAQNAIHRVNLTVEPVTFGAGLPIFSDQQGKNALEIFSSLGFSVVDQRQLNDRGTQYFVLQPEK